MDIGASLQAALSRQAELTLSNTSQVLLLCQASGLINIHGLFHFNTQVEC